MLEKTIVLKVSEIQDRIPFIIKTGYYLELSTTETIELLGSTERRITQDKNCENIPQLEITEVVLVHSDVLNNQYQYDLGVLCTFVPNKSFDQLLNISPTSYIY